MLRLIINNSPTTSQAALQAPCSPEVKVELSIPEVMSSERIFSHRKIEKHIYVFWLFSIYSQADRFNYGDVRMSRVIRGLISASLSSRIPHVPQKRRKGAKAAGLRYERALASALPFALHGQWFDFFDAGGPGYCQPDFIARFINRPLIIEAKMSDVEGGRQQLRYLYEPIVARALGSEPIAVVAVRHLSALRETEGLYRVCETLRGAILSAEREPKRLAIWHWRERTPIGLGDLVPQPPIPKAFAARAA